MYDLAENDDFDREMIATYEEVAKLYPRRPGANRPIVRFN
jgi:MAGUK p55 subfamily member 3/7